MTRLDGVMVVEATQHRTAANDLARVRLGVSTNSMTNVDYLGLTGSNVVLNINDTGWTSAIPTWVAVESRLTRRPAGRTRNGHGTHVTGTILGNGSQSPTVGPTRRARCPTRIFAGWRPTRMLM